MRIKVLSARPEYLPFSRQACRYPGKRKICHCVVFGLSGKRISSYCLKKIVKLVLSFECFMTGLEGKSSLTSEYLIWSSFHLNMRVPSGFSTRQHSLNPSRRYFFQSLGGRTPYFCASQEEAPADLRCGGSKMMRGNVSFPKGIFRKSMIMSGFISSFLNPPDEDLSFSRVSNSRQSQKSTRSSDRST